jgi:hypothetical protein
MGATCPNHRNCGMVSWRDDDSDAIDIKVEMDEFVRLNLNGNWRRLISKVEDEHHRNPSLRKLNRNQRKKRSLDRIRRSRSYSSKFPNIYQNFPSEDWVPYAPSVTAGMPLLATMSYGLYNNVSHFPDALNDFQKLYITGRKDLS